MKALTPGLYKATVRGVPDTIVMVNHDGFGYLINPILGTTMPGADWITDARPLIVLDLVDSQVSYLRAAFNRWRNWSSLTDEKRTLDGLLGQIEAQTRPTRIPEPCHGERVTAQLGNRHPERHDFLRIRTSGEFQWADLADGHVYLWSALTNPTLICPWTEATS